MIDPEKIVKLGLFTQGTFISRGSFADTYETTTDDGAPAILKWLRQDAPAGGSQRFQNECWALCKLGHPAIPRFIAQGDQDGRPYIVMTRAPGRSLRKRLQEPIGERGTFGEDWVLRIVENVLSAVCSAQEVEITHRDIKDDNVVCDELASSVFLIDFGFCKGPSQPVDADSFYQVGAPRFSPPAKLRHPSVTHPTHDVFAVGVLAYLLLTNSYPWSVPADQDHGFLAALMENRVPPEITDLNSIISYETTRFVSTLIVTEDNRRPTAADALARTKQILDRGKQRRYPSHYRITFPKVSRDPIHGDVRLTEQESLTTDTLSFQRLRYVKQLGFAHLAYLGAQHTRLSHSIGTMFVADRIVQSIADSTGSNIDPEERLLIRSYALTHDVGHMPFGHTIEDELGFFERHDRNASRMERLFRRDPSFHKILECTSYGRTILGDFLSSTPATELSLARDVVDGHTGADVLDYVDRDSIYCGVDHQVDTAIFRQYSVFPIPAGAHEPARHLVSRMYGSRGIRTDASFSMEGLLIQRFALFMKIYTHPAKLSAGAMLGKALQNVLDDKGTQQLEEEIEWMGDDELLIWLRDSEKYPEAAELARMLLKRHLYKSVFLADTVAIDDRNLNGYSSAQSRRLDLKVGSPVERAQSERTIAQNAGVDSKCVIIYWPKEAPGLQKIKHYVQEFPGQVPSEAASSLNSRMIERHLAIWRTWVFSHPDLSPSKRENVRIAAEAFFGRQNLLPPER